MTMNNTNTARSSVGAAMGALERQISAANCPVPIINVARLAQWLRFDCCGDPELEAMVRAVGMWFFAVRCKVTPRFLVLTGKSGIGKTHIADQCWDRKKARVWRSSQRSSYIPHFISWPSFVGTDSAKDQGFIGDLRYWSLLVLDDIGSEQDSWGHSKDLLCRILSLRARRWTIITSNLSVDEWAKLDSRIADRLIRDSAIVCESKAGSYSRRRYHAQH